MSTTDHILTHKQFVQLLRLCLSNLGVPKFLHKGAIRGLYPAKPIDALAELSARGFDTTLQRVCEFCCDKSNGVVRKGSSYWLSVEQIDNLAAELLVENKINSKARERLASGMTADEKLYRTAAELERTARQVAGCRN